MGKYKELTPYIVFYGLFFGLLGLAFVVNNLTLAKYYGSVAGVLTDPLVLVVGFLCGAVINRMQYLLPALLLAAIVVSYLIAEINVDLIGYKKFNLEMVLIRFVALVFIALLINCAVILFKKKARM